MERPYVSESPFKGKTGIARLIGATRNSLAGFVEAARHEDAFRQELLGAAVFVPLGLWLGASGVERALLVGAVLLGLIVELLNSGIEGTVERVSFEGHQLGQPA